MRSLTTEFLDEIEQSIKARKIMQNRYEVLKIGLGVIIASSGFLTAAASQAEMKTAWISSPSALLIFGLLSAICAIVNQIVAPGEQAGYHREIRLALQHIRGEVKFRNMTIKKAQLLKTLANTTPELVLGKLHDEYTTEANR